MAAEFAGLVAGGAHHAATFRTATDQQRLTRQGRIVQPLDGGENRVDVKMTLTAQGCGMGTSIAVRTCSWCASLVQLTTTSSSRIAVFTSKPRSPEMLPPTSPMAIARRPSMPGSLTMRTRIRMRWCRSPTGRNGR